MKSEEGRGKGEGGRGNGEEGREGCEINQFLLKFHNLAKNSHALRK